MLVKDGEGENTRQKHTGHKKYHQPSEGHRYPSFMKVWSFHATEILNSRQWESPWGVRLLLDLNWLIMYYMDEQVTIHW